MSGKEQCIDVLKRRSTAAILYKLAEAEKDISIRGIFYRALAESF
jgi:hypothetical protein